LSLFLRGWALVGWVVSRMGILTHKSLTFNVINLWLVPILSLINSLASDSELVVLYS
jgi:hypothetical protein